MNFTLGFALGTLRPEVDHEQATTEGWSAPSLGQATPHRSRSTDISAHPSPAGDGAGETRCPYCPELRREPADALQLVGALPAKLRSGGATRSQGGRTPRLLDCAAASCANGEFSAASRSLGLPSRQLDRASVTRALGGQRWPAAVRLHPEAAIVATGICMEAAPLCIGARSRAREKNAASGGGSPSWGRAAPYCLKTKLICSCFRPCGPVGPNGDKTLPCLSAVPTRGGWSLAPLTRGLVTGCFGSGDDSGPKTSVCSCLRSILRIGGGKWSRWWMKIAAIRLGAPSDWRPNWPWNCSGCPGAAPSPAPWMLGGGAGNNPSVPTANTPLLRNKSSGSWCIYIPSRRGRPCGKLGFYRGTSGLKLSCKTCELCQIRSDNLLRG